MSIGDAAITPIRFLQHVSILTHPWIFSRIPQQTGGVHELLGLWWRKRYGLHGVERKAITEIWDSETETP